MRKSNGPEGGMSHTAARVGGAVVAFLVLCWQHRRTSTATPVVKPLQIAAKSATVVNCATHVRI